MNGWRRHTDSDTATESNEGEVPARKPTLQLVVAPLFLSASEDCRSIPAWLWRSQFSASLTGTTLISPPLSLISFSW